MLNSTLYSLEHALPQINFRETCIHTQSYDHRTINLPEIPTKVCLHAMAIC